MNEFTLTGLQVSLEFGEARLDIHLLGAAKLLQAFTTSVNWEERRLPDMLAAAAAAAVAALMCQR